jgi:hypothetical protein
MQIPSKAEAFIANMGVLVTIKKRGIGKNYYHCRSYKN